MKKLSAILVCAVLAGCASGEIRKNLTLKIQAEEVTYPMGLTSIKATNATITLNRTAEYIRHGQPKPANKLP